MADGGLTGGLVAAAVVVVMTIVIAVSVNRAKKDRARRPPAGPTVGVVPAAPAAAPAAPSPPAASERPLPIPEEQFSTQTEVENVPKYWKNQSSGDPFFELVTVHGDELELLQRVVEETWKDVHTRDRQSHPVYGQKVPRLVVLSARRVENSKLWARYQGGLRRIRAKAPAEERILYGLEMATTVSFRNDLRGQDLATDLNECFLFHGTSPSGAQSITRNGFEVSKAGDNVGSLFGRGVYFAECSSKADEYALGDASGALAGMYALLLCRVTCGDIYYDKSRLPSAVQNEDRVRAGGYDCILGDREVVRNTYREIVVFAPDVIYPEFVVIIKHVYD